LLLIVSPIVDLIAFFLFRGETPRQRTRHSVDLSGRRSGDSLRLKARAAFNLRRSPFNTAAGAAKNP
jgi:hypothetical protein